MSSMNLSSEGANGRWLGEPPELAVGRFAVRSEGSLEDCALRLPFG